MAWYNRIAWTSAQDEAIRRAYASGERGAAVRLAREFGVKPNTITGRAARLGLPPIIDSPGSPRWRQVELDLVRAHLGEPITQIRARLYKKGFGRSPSSIEKLIRRKRAAGDWPTRADQAEQIRCLFTPEIAAGLGVTTQRVEHWIRQGYLPARPLGGDRLVVSWRDLREFLFIHAGRWNLRQTDKWFLLDVFTFGSPDANRLESLRAREAA